MFSRTLGSIVSSHLNSPHWGLAGIGSTIAIVALIAPAQAASLTAWNFDPNTNHLEVTVKDGTTPRYFLMAQPARIVMDLPGTSIAGVKTQASYSGAVRQIRVSQFQPGMTRIVLELSPGVKLASGQVNLQKLGDSTRWMLKPLLADAIATTERSIPPIATNPAPRPVTVAVPAPITPRTIAAIPLPRPEIALVPASIAPRSIAASPAAASPTAAIVPPALPQNPAVAPVSTQLPQSPLAPAPVSTPIAAVKPEPAIAAIVTPALPQNSGSVPPIGGDLPPLTPVAPVSAPIAATPLPPTIVPPVPQPITVVPPSVLPVREPLTPLNTTALRPAPAPLFPTAAAPASLEIPTTLATVQPTPVITVPSVQKPNPSSVASGSSVDLMPTTTQALQPPETTRSTTPESAQVTVPPLSPNPIAPTSQAPTVSVPPLQPQAASPIAPTVPAPPQTQVIEFGQPLPGSPALRSGLTAGTLLSLRYPGVTSLKLRTGTPHQEVLLLQSELRDPAGNLIAPKDSKVIGRFETTKAGSRFIVQAIALQGRSLPLQAQSELLAGNLKVSDRNLAVNSGIGAIAGGIIGGFSGAGLAGGAATGAAVTLLTSPKPATVQPGQIVQVRLLQDLR